MVQNHFLLLLLLCYVCHCVNYTLFIGTWSPNVHVLHFDNIKNTFTKGGTIDVGLNPSFLSFDQSKQFLIAVNEVDDFQHLTNTGGIVSYHLKTQKIVSLFDLGHFLQKNQVEFEKEATEMNVCTVIN